MHTNVPQVYDRMAAAYAETGEFEKAIDAIDEGLRLAATNPALQALLTRHRLVLMANRPLRIDAAGK